MTSHRRWWRWSRVALPAAAVLLTFLLLAACIQIQADAADTAPSARAARDQDVQQPLTQGIVRPLRVPSSESELSAAPASPAKPPPVAVVITSADSPQDEPVQRKVTRIHRVTPLDNDTAWVEDEVIVVERSASDGRAQSGSTDVAAIDANATDSNLMAIQRIKQDLESMKRALLDRVLQPFEEEAFQSLEEMNKMLQWRRALAQEAHAQLEDSKERRDKLDSAVIRDPADDAVKLLLDLVHDSASLSENSKRAGTAQEIQSAPSVASRDDKRLSEARPSKSFLASVSDRAQELGHRAINQMIETALNFNTFFGSKKQKKGEREQPSPTSSESQFQRIPRPTAPPADQQFRRDQPAQDRAADDERYAWEREQHARMGQLPQRWHEHKERMRRQREEDQRLRHEREESYDRQHGLDRQRQYDDSHRQTQSTAASTLSSIWSSTWQRIDPLSKLKEAAERNKGPVPQQPTHDDENEHILQELRRKEHERRIEDAQHDDR